MNDLPLATSAPLPAANGHLLLVRDAQFKALEAGLIVPLYEQQMLAYLRRHHGAATAGQSEAALLEQLRTLAAKACSYGAQDAVAWSLYLELAMSFGADFDRAPWATEILERRGDGALSWPEKARALVGAAAVHRAAAGA